MVISYKHQKEVIMCGIAGIYSEKSIKILPILHDMGIMNQHRGQEGAGYAIFDGKAISYERRISKEKDSISHLFSKIKRPNKKAKAGIIHNRYSTRGGTDRIENVQPLFISTNKGKVAIAHNGTLVYAPKIKNALEKDGRIFMSDSDTEVILQLIADSKKTDLLDAITESLDVVKGSYSLIFLTEDGLIAARDNYGFRPLSIAEFDYGYLVSSETCSFGPLIKELGITSVKEVQPGEISVINNNGFKVVRGPNKIGVAQCIFELIYFARPDSIVFGKSVHAFRKMLGRSHALEQQIKVDCIIPIPDSSTYFSLEHARVLNVNLELGFVRNHYTGRTFINPDGAKRDKNIRLKLNIIEELIRGHDTGIDDDSIVRGATIKKVVKMVKRCQPKSTTVSISCPPNIDHCPYGIDVKTKKELIANGKTIEEIRQEIGADDLRYLNLETLKKLGGNNFCYACFDGNYPLK